MPNIVTDYDAKMVLAALLEWMGPLMEGDLPDTAEKAVKRLRTGQPEMTKREIVSLSMPLIMVVKHKGANTIPNLLRLIESGQ